MPDPSEDYIRGWNDAITAANLIIADAFNDQSAALRRRIATLSPSNNELLDADVQSLTQWSVRTANALYNLGIRTVRDLIATDKRALRGIPNLGKVSRREIENALARHGLRLD